MKKIRILLPLIITIIYEELLFSYLIFNNMTNVFFKITFSLIFSIFLYLIIINLSKKHRKTIRNIVITAISILFASQFVYYQIYKSIISFYSFSNGGQVFQFWQTILNIILTNWNKILLIIYPIINILAIYITKKINKKNKLICIKMHTVKKENPEKSLVPVKSRISVETKQKIRSTIKGIIYIIVLQTIVVLAINLKGTNDIYSETNLYNKSHVPTLMAEKFGLLTTMRLDLQRLVTDFNDDTLLVTSNNFQKVNEEHIIEYNMLNIDWNSIIENESNETIKNMHEYFSVQEPTKKNEYTGMFKGKNVIVFVAEAFNEVAIDENITPTLYKMYQQGFQFENFYTPLFPVSTADGEYISDTSLIPKENVWSISKISDNYMPYSYANVFEKLGYTSHAYHDHSSTYYDRDQYLKGMGYNSYLAIGTGLEERMDCSHWPNSDLDMINVTVDDYINDGKFLAYYMTVSGHLEYNIGGNYIANKNWDLVKDLPYSDKAKCYMATQIELDRAVEQLINKLEETGRLDDTVIIISGDHYPYGLTLDELNELSDYEKDDNFEKHRMPFLIWNSTMSEPVKVDKIGSSLDILPTVLNLFGIDYDSRLLMGKDLMSDSDGLVIFSNRSFITSRGRYNSLKKIFERNKDCLNNDFNDEEYVNEISKIIYNKYQISRLILENDYYKILFK